MNLLEIPFNDGDTWRERAAELAAHTLKTLIVDQHNWYSVRRAEERNSGKLVSERSGKLTPATVARHFEGLKVEHLLVVSGFATIPSYHAVGGYGWLGFSIEPQSGGDEAAARRVSWSQTLKLAAHLDNLGLPILIEHADGLGTYQVWLALQWDGMEDWEEIKSIPSAAFVKHLLKEAELAPEVFSTWLPLPGRHHTQAWWSQFWCNGEWSRGQAAVEALLSMPTASVSVMQDVCRRYLTQSAPNASGSSVRPGDFTSGIRNAVDDILDPKNASVPNVSPGMTTQIADSTPQVPRDAPELPQASERGVATSESDDHMPLLKKKAVWIAGPLLYGVLAAMVAESLGVGLIVFGVFVAIAVLIGLSNKLDFLRDENRELKSELERRQRRDKIARFNREVVELNAMLELETDPKAVDFLRNEIVDFKQHISELEEEEASEGMSWP